jgi:PD-(D/E)XK nuclease family transposase
MPYAAAYVVSVSRQRGDRLMILGINPTVDYAFKHLLGREATRPILINVLDSVLQPVPGHGIRDIELLNPFNPKEALDDKLSILDIKARDQSGRQFKSKCKCSQGGPDGRS